jgi:predicted membrane protein
MTAQPLSPTTSTLEVSLVVLLAWAAASSWVVGRRVAP